MASVKTNKQVYLFCHYPYQFNTEYLEGFKSHLKLSKSYNGAVGYHPCLATEGIIDKHNITSESTSEEHKTNSNIKLREKSLTCMPLSESYYLRYKKLKTKPKNNYIFGLYGHSQ